MYTLKEEVDEEDEISCTPALAPSRLAQNIPSNQLPPGKETLQEHPTTFASTSETINMIGLDCSTVEGKHMCANSGNNAAIMKEYFASVDPSLSRSFLNVLYAGENNDSNPCQPKVSSQFYLLIFFFCSFYKNLFSVYNEHLPVIHCPNFFKALCSVFVL